MKAKVKAIHFDASEKLVAFIDKKVDKFCRHSEEISDVEITLKVVKPETSMNKEAGIKIASAAFEDMFASKVADSFEEAIDNALDALDKQLEKQKAKK